MSLTYIGGPRDGQTFDKMEHPKFVSCWDDIKIGQFIGLYQERDGALHWRLVVPTRIKTSDDPRVDRPLMPR